MENFKPLYRVIKLPAASEQIMQAFEDLPLDPYHGKGQRYRRFSQYKISFRGDSWHLELLPHRPFLQSKEYNRFVGGIPRFLEPLKIDPTSHIDAGAKALGLDPCEVYQINIHQCRVITSGNVNGVSVPEGPHRDGHEFGMLAVFRRSNIKGGTSVLMPTGGGEPFFEYTLQESEALIYEDGAMWHNATDIESVDGEEGYRDLWIVAFNKWDQRRYGEEFEARVRGEM